MPQSTFTKPQVVASHEGLPVVAPGTKMLHKLSGADTGSLFTFGSVEVEPGFGPPLHVHTHEDEMFYILEGEIEFTIDGKTFVAGAGTTVFGPRGVPHAFRGAGEKAAKFLIFVTGDNFERFYPRWEAAMVGGDFARAEEIAEAHGIRFVN